MLGVMYLVLVCVGVSLNSNNQVLALITTLPNFQQGTHIHLVVSFKLPCDVFITSRSVNCDSHIYTRISTLEKC
jgi:hypothetical protein